MDIATHIVTRVADISAAQEVIRNYLRPTMLALIGLATLACTFFIITAGIRYMTSSGKPEQLEQAKRVLKNACIGLVMVIAATSLTGILTKAYGTSHTQNVQTIPNLSTIEEADQGAGVVEVLIKGIIGLFKYIVESAGKPFIAALEYFTKETPLMAKNPGVFKLWLAIVAIADLLFILVIALLGFHVMSAAALGIDEIELKHLAPQLIFTFLLINISIFAIDAVISLSNVLIKALSAAFDSTSVWNVLTKIAEGADGMSLVALLIMVVFMTLSVILLVYYIMRIVTLYLGAVLSPLIVLLAVLPGFKDFVVTAVKTYVATIFVLFVHIVILTLAASLFATSLTNEPGSPNPLMSMLIGIATLIALLKTQSVMMQMSYVSAGPRALRKLGGQFVNAAAYTAGKFRGARSAGAEKPSSSTRMKSQGSAK